MRIRAQGHASRSAGSLYFDVCPPDADCEATVLAVVAGAPNRPRRAARCMIDDQ